MSWHTFYLVGVLVASVFSIILSLYTARQRRKTRNAHKDAYRRPAAQSQDYRILEHCCDTSSSLDGYLSCLDAYASVLSSTWRHHSMTPSTNTTPFISPTNEDQHSTDSTPHTSPSRTPTLLHQCYQSCYDMWYPLFPELDTCIASCQEQYPRDSTAPPSP